MDETPVTVLLHKWREGDALALEQLTPVIYAELRRLAGATFRRERSNHTLQPTALVHEAYLKLIGLEDRDQPNWENRAHFLATAARLMRQILVDHARRHQAAKRGGGAIPEESTDDLPASDPRSVAFLALEDALAGLAKVDPAKGRMIELRFFGGLTGEEIAHVMGTSTATVTRGMRLAESWLAREMGASAKAGS